MVGATYAWTGPNGFSSNLQNPVINSIIAADAGVYSVTVTLTRMPEPCRYYNGRGESNPDHSDGV
ncbi:MAG: hypothetical protein U5K79_14065 [Cyclobacteriaceae bacterium]|nr:hypothetical protein [Cyclobacteriaceae bacterium]